MEIVKDAFQAGCKIKENTNNENIYNLAHKFQQIKSNKNQLIHHYLKTIIKNKVKHNNEFMIEMLVGEKSSDEVGTSLVLGMMSEDTDIEKSKEI